jgi:hypothetical protein
MLSQRIKENVVKINALFDYYDDLSKRKLKDKSDLQNTKEKMFFARKRVIELTADIKKTVKEFEGRL